MGQDRRRVRARSGCSRPVAQSRSPDRACPQIRPCSRRYSSCARTDSSAAGHSDLSTSAYTCATTSAAVTVAVLDGRLDLGEPVRAVRQIELDRALGVVQYRAVARQHRVHPVVDRERAQPAQGVEVVAEPPVRVRDERRAAPEDRVAGQHRPVGGEVEAERVGGVPGRGDDPQSRARRS